jgi:hypothetical protein
MKFWQLMSIAREEDRDLVRCVASTCPRWKKYELLAVNFPALVDAQDRIALDSLVDSDFVAAVLGKVRKNLYLSSDNWLRSWPLNVSDQVLSVLEAVTRYGGDVVEEIFEFGSMKVR